MSTTPAPRFTNEADQALATITTLVVPTDLPGSGCVDVARASAKAAAADHDLAVILYDRSHETWMDHPHPSGPHRASDLPDGYDNLAEQLRQLESDGIDARGWISTVPSLAEITTAVLETGADGVLLPDPSCDRTLVDKLSGRRDPNSDVAVAIERDAQRPVVVLAIQGDTVDVLADASTRNRMS